MKGRTDMKRVAIAVVGMAIACLVVGIAFQASAKTNAKTDDEAEIKSLEQRIVDGAKARDVDAIMENFLPDETLVVFDVIPPRQYVGADAYHKDWEGFLGTFDGPITFENSDMTVMSDGKMAFAH